MLFALKFILGTLAGVSIVFALLGWVIFLSALYQIYTNWTFDHYNDEEEI